MALEIHASDAEMVALTGAEQPVVDRCERLREKRRLQRQAKSRFHRRVSMELASKDQELEEKEQEIQRLRRRVEELEREVRDQSQGAPPVHAVRPLPVSERRGPAPSIAQSPALPQPSTSAFYAIDAPPVRSRLGSPIPSARRPPPGWGDWPRRSPPPPEDIIEEFTRQLRGRLRRAPFLLPSGGEAGNPRAFLRQVLEFLERTQRPIVRPG